MPVVGAVRSIFTTGVLSAVVVLPALSVTEVVAFRPVPSPPIVLLAGTPLPRPDVASLAVHFTVTSPLYQPLPFAFVVGAPLSVGAVMSTLMPLMDAGALVLSALSVAVPLTDW